LAADVTLRPAVDSVTDGHVVGGDRLGDGSGRAPDGKEPPRDLLSAADLGERAVGPGAKVEGEGFLPSCLSRVHLGLPQGDSWRRTAALVRRAPTTKDKSYSPASPPQAPVGRTGSSPLSKH